MYKNRVFRFKSQEHMYNFAFCWEGQADQQICVADFIGIETFQVIDCTPGGGVRMVQRTSDGCCYFTHLAEPLIDRCEMDLFFSEEFQK